MKATYATLQNDVNNLKQLQDDYTNAPHKYHQVGKKELGRRINLINEIIEMIEGELTREYRSIEAQQAALNSSSNTSAAKYVRGEDGEFDQTRELENRQVL